MASAASHQTFPRTPNAEHRTLNPEGEKPHCPISRLTWITPGCIFDGFMPATQTNYSVMRAYAVISNAPHGCRLAWHQVKGLNSTGQQEGII